MKNLTFLLLFLTLFTACTPKKEEKLPVNPTQWLSQIKNEEAKKRTTDVLEKIYISTAYSVLEKDSLSEMQVRLSNCELYDSTKDIRMFEKWIKSNYYREREDLNREYLSYVFSLYDRDTTVFRAAVNVLLNTSDLYILNEIAIRYPSYDTTNHAIKLSKIVPSKKILNMENEVLELIDSMERLDDKSEWQNSKKIRSVASKKIFQLLKEPTSYDYALPKVSKKIKVLYSPDKKFKVFYFQYLASGEDGAYYTANSYIQYRKSINDKVIIEQIKSRIVNTRNYAYPSVPRQIFQVERNGNPVYIILHDENASMGENYTILQAIEIKDRKAVACKDCIEGEELKIYQRYNRTGSFAVFNDKKQQLSFIATSITPMTSNLTVIKKYVLQWNGQQFVSIPLKLYCEE